MYSGQLLDHFQNPRNAENLMDPDAVVEVKNPVCGDVLRLSLKMEDGRIARVGFKAKGCVPSIACGSALTELMVGKTTEQARAISREEITVAVGGLPQASTHAAQLALDAVSELLRQASPTKR